MGKNFRIITFIIIFLIPVASYAAGDGQGGILDDVLKDYESKISAWETAFHRAGIFIFWALGTISVVMTGAQLIFQRDNISSFFAEIIRLILFLGFFLWILTNGVAISTAVRDGLMQLAGQASGNGSVLTPSGIVDLGFDLFATIVEARSIWSPVDSAVLTIVGIIILLILALVGVNMLMVLVTTYMVIYAGIIILGFGGGRWTSDMAIGYLKQVLNLSLQLAAMILIIGIGQAILQSSINAVGKPGFANLAVILVEAVILLGLIVKIPPLIGSLAGGTGSGGIGSFGVGSAITATAMVAGAAAGAGAALKSLATEAGGLIKAFQAAKAGLGGSNNSSGSPDSGSRKMDSAVDAVGGASAGDKSNQDGKPLAAESSGASGGNSGNSSGGSTTGNSGGNPSGSSGENTISSGSSSSSGEANSTNTSASSGAEGSAEGEATSSETSQSASDSPSNNSGEATQTADTTPKTTNTGGGSPLATAMGGNKVSNWQAAKNVAVGLVSSKWNNAVNNSAGGRLVKHWEDEKKKTEDPTKNPQKNPEGDDNA